MKRHQQPAIRVANQRPLSQQWRRGTAAAVEPAKAAWHSSVLSLHAALVSIRRGTSRRRCRSGSTAGRRLSAASQRGWVVCSGRDAGVAIVQQLGNAGRVRISQQPGDGRPAADCRRAGGAARLPPYDRCAQVCLALHSGTKQKWKRDDASNRCAPSCTQAAQRRHYYERHSVLAQQRTRQRVWCLDVRRAGPAILSHPSSLAAADASNARGGSLDPPHPPLPWCRRLSSSAPAPGSWCAPAQGSAEVGGYGRMA